MRTHIHIPTHVHREVMLRIPWREQDKRKRKHWCGHLFRPNDRTSHWDMVWFRFVSLFFFNVWYAFRKGTSLFLLKKRSRCWNLDCCEPLFSIFIGFSPEIKEESCGNHPREIVVFFRYGLFCASSDAYTFLELDYQNNHIITNSQMNRSIAIDRKMEASKIYSCGNKEVNNIIHGVRLLLNKSNRFHNSWKKDHAHPLAWCSSCHQFFAHYLPNPGPLLLVENRAENQIWRADCTSLSTSLFKQD